MGLEGVNNYTGTSFRWLNRPNLLQQFLSKFHSILVSAMDHFNWGLCPQLYSWSLTERTGGSFWSGLGAMGRIMNCLHLTA